MTPPGSTPVAVLYASIEFLSWPMIMSVLFAGGAHVSPHDGQYGPDAPAGRGTSGRASSSSPTSKRRTDRTVASPFWTLPPGNERRVVIQGRSASAGDARGVSVSGASDGPPRGRIPA